MRAWGRTSRVEKEVEKVIGKKTDRDCQRGAAFRMQRDSGETKEVEWGIEKGKKKTQDQSVRVWRGPIKSEGGLTTSGKSGGRPFQEGRSPGKKHGGRFLKLP